MIIWFTGLSGSGKTTFSNSLYTSLKNLGLKNVIWLDGDVLRGTLSKDLGYDLKSRISQVKRTQRLVKVLDEQGLTVIVSMLYSNPDLLSWNRDNFESYFEIYIESSIDDLMKRDGKQLYGKAVSGEITDVVGIDIMWQKPLKPDLTVNNGRYCDIDSITKKITDSIKPKLDLGDI